MKFNRIWIAIILISFLCTIANVMNGIRFRKLEKCVIALQQEIIEMQEIQIKEMEVSKDVD